MTKYEIVEKIEDILGQPTTKLWRASKPTLEALLKRLERPSQLSRLYDAADTLGANHMETLSEMASAAGLTWECRGGDEFGPSHWTNPETATHCEECGDPRPEKAPA